MTKDRWVRSVVKAVTWRVIAVLVTALSVVAFTHEWNVAIIVGGLTGIINLILYYFHERIWENIAWGKIAVKKKK